MLVLSLLVLGFTSLAAQVMLTRELLVTFYGNEFFIGWTLFAWLFWVGVGSVLEKIIKNESGDILFIALCHLATAILLPLELILVRSGRPFLAASPGQIPDLLPVMIVSFFVLAPLCAVFGLQFALVARSWTAGKAYLSEVLGFVLGALAFSYYFAFCNEFMTAVAIMGLNVSAAGLLSFSNKSLLGKKIWAGIYLTVFFGSFAVAVRTL